MKTNSTNNIIDKFYELSSEAFDNSDELIYQELGISKDEYLQDRLKNIKQLKFRKQAQLNKIKNDNLLEKAWSKFQDIISSSDIDMKKVIGKLIQERAPQFQFRNIENLNTETLKDLFGELNIIELIENLEKLDKNDK